MSICNEESRDSMQARRPAGREPAVSLRVMLVDDDTRTAFVTQAVLGTGHEVMAHLCADEDLLSAVRRLEPDLVLVDVDRPAPQVLEHCAAITRQLPRPIVFFARNADADAITEAMRAGVTTYIVDGLSEIRLRSILDVALARFREHQKLRDELEEMRTRLADRRDVERAKSMLSRLRKIDEAAAYTLLRRSAMARRITIGEAARTMLAAADLFDTAGES